MAQLPFSKFYFGVDVHNYRLVVAYSSLYSDVLYEICVGCED